MDLPERLPDSHEAGAFRRACGKIPSSHSVRHQTPAQAGGGKFGSESWDKNHGVRVAGINGFVNRS